MRNIFSIIALSFIFLCASLLKQKDITEVDFYGISAWRLTADSLRLDMVGDFTGNAVAFIGAVTDSGRQVAVEFPDCRFVAPLGDESFAKNGNITFRGILKEHDNTNELIFNIVSGDGGFSETSGYIDLFWNDDDEWIYYVGIFRF